ITVVSIPEQVAGKIHDPSFIATTIPARTYDGQTEAVPTVAINNFLVTRADLEEETVYALTRSMFENLADLKAAHAAAEVISLETATRGSPVPLHPGAERYYREKGVVK
ncbi:MAG: TAXI family TRAP transporter solute-binding subunit, partial [Rhodospirillales bacterium]